MARKCSRRKKLRRGKSTANGEKTLPGESNYRETSFRYQNDNHIHFPPGVLTHKMKISSPLFCVSALLIAATMECTGQSITLNEKRIHLGEPGSPEWEEFAADPAQSGRFEVRFKAEPNAGEATLFIRQDDVKQEWRVEVNRRAVGKLFKMEANLVQTITLPPGTLTAGENVLAIVPPPGDPDDILLHEISLDARPVADAHDATLSVAVSDMDGVPLPCRITVVDERGALAPILAAALQSDGKNTPLAIRPGVAYTPDGRARLRLRHGRYTVFASRGFEWGVASRQVEVASGASGEMALKLAREVPTPGLVSCDTHVHTFTNSRHGDATLEERVLTLAGEGIELPIASDHDIHADLSGPAARAGVSGFFTTVIGNEVTTKTGHFNIFPVTNPAAPVADSKITDWPQLMTAMRATPGVQVVVLNHPRSIHTAFRPFDPAHFNSASGDNKRGPDFTFDALELLNSGAQQTDYLVVYRDWFALLNHGYRIIGVGASDSHDVSRFIVGQARTYLAAPDDNPAKIDVAAACRSLKEGRALVSMGLLTQMTVAGKFGVGDLATGLSDEVSVEVTVSGPEWVQANRVALYANGTKIQESEIGTPASSATASKSEKARVHWTVPRTRHDVHLVAIATGPPVTAPFWAMTKPYQPASPRWEGRGIGSTNPVWLDADADGTFTAAREYARRLVVHQGTDPARLLPALSGYDEAVAAQAASLCSAAGAKLNDATFTAALKAAAPQVAAGFANYIAAAAAPSPQKSPSSN